jgi:hypothetical protein
VFGIRSTNVDFLGTPWREAGFRFRQSCPIRSGMITIISHDRDHGSIIADHCCRR